MYMPKPKHLFQIYKYTPDGEPVPTPKYFDLDMIDAVNWKTGEVLFKGEYQTLNCESTVKISIKLEPKDLARLAKSLGVDYKAIIEELNREYYAKVKEYKIRADTLAADFDHVTGKSDKV